MERDFKRGTDWQREIQHLVLPETLLQFDGVEFAHDPQLIIDSITSYYEELVGDTPQGLQYLTPFQQFQTVDRDLFFLTIRDFLTNMHTITYKSYDAVRYIKNVSVKTPPLLKTAFSPSLKWHTNIEVARNTHLGDGTAVYSEVDKKWQFTQRNGRYTDTTLLQTRQIYK